MDTFVYLNVTMRRFDRFFSRLVLAQCLALAFLWLPAGVLNAAELIMFERTGCAWCKRWDEEVGRIYPLTEEGKNVRLRRVNIDRGVPAEFQLTPPVFYSPTFVLIDAGKEKGRITGYSGDDVFWGQFGVLLRQFKH